MTTQKFGALNHRNESRQRANAKSAGGEEENSKFGGLKHSAAESAPTMASQVQEVLDLQVAKGARIVSNVAHSARRAAKDLEADTPQIAGLVRGVAERLEDYSRNLEHQSVTDIYEAASDFTRRQPALVFGVAALAGFFTLRTLRSSQTGSAAGGVGRRGSDLRREEFHGS
jgi:hypothetical protein